MSESAKFLGYSSFNRKWIIERCEKRILQIRRFYFREYLKTLRRLCVLDKRSGLRKFASTILEILFNREQNPKRETVRISKAKLAHRHDLAEPFFYARENTKRWREQDLEKIELILKLAKTSDQDFIFLSESAIQELA